MKKMMLMLFLMVGSARQAYCQYEPPVSQPQNTTPAAEEKLPQLYVGLGTGINGKDGLLGINMGTRAGKYTVIDLAVGGALWGTKVSISGTFKVKDKNCWCPSVGFSRIAGGDAKDVAIQVNYNGKDIDAKANLKFEAINLINLSMQKQWLSAKRRNRLILELGYSLCLNSLPAYHITNGVVYINGVEVSETTAPMSEAYKKSFQLITPGGLIVGLRYQFALN